MKVQGSVPLRLLSNSRPRPIRRRPAYCHCTDCPTSTGSVFRTNVPVPGKDLQNAVGHADHLREDDSGKRQSEGASVLPEMRHADLLDHARRRPEAVLHGAGRDAARSAHQLVPKMQNWSRSAQPWLATARHHPAE